MADLVRIVTLKWGARYGANYVNMLHRAVTRHLRRPHQFVCFTDDSSGLASGIEPHPIPEIDLPPAAAVTGWRKLCLFRDDLPLDGLCLFLDLDIVITGPLDDFFTFARPDDIPIIHNWVLPHKKLFRPDPHIGNSSVFRFQANRCRFVWDQFHRERDWALANFRPPQSYLTHCIRPRMVYWPDAWVKSFKRHCRPVFPLNLILTPQIPTRARIVVFHGRPDPDEAMNGYRGTKLHHRNRPVPWIKTHWS
jgi:hypothetical protein